jgi:hypothetical protein
MVEQNFQVVRINIGLLRAAIEKIFRVLDYILVERRAGGDQYGNRRTLSPARAAGPLPCGRDSPGITGQYHRIKRTDVHTEFQGVGGHYGTNVASPKLILNLAALFGKVTAAISANRFMGEGQLRTRIFQVRDKDFRGKAAVGENQSLLLLSNEFERDPAAFMEIAAPDSKLAVDYGRIVKNEVSFARGRSALGYQLKGFSRDLLGKFFRVADRCRRADELRPRSVKFADSFQSS